MANIKLTNDYWETSGIYDIGQSKTQRQINSDLNGALSKLTYKTGKDWNFHTNLSECKYYDGTVHQATLSTSGNVGYGVLTAISGRLYYRDLTSSLLFQKLVWEFNTRSTQPFAFGTYNKGETTSARFGVKFKITPSTGALQISKSDWLNDSNDDVKRNLNIGFTIAAYKIIRVTVETIGVAKIKFVIESVSNPENRYEYIHDTTSDGDQNNNKCAVYGGICFETLGTSGECYIYQMSQIADNDNQADILLIGDSFITATQSGFGTDYGFAYLIRNEIGDKCVAGGIAGITSTKLLELVTSGSFDVGHFKYVFIQIGSNDSIATGMTLDTFKSNIQAIIAYFEANNCTPILTTIPIRTDTSNDNDFRTNANSWIKGLGKYFIDEATFLTSSYLQSDGAHPNANGHRAIYNALTGLIGEISTVQNHDKDILYYTSQTVSVASNDQIMRIPASGTDSAITTDTVVLNCTFATPTNITTDVSWQSYTGYIAFTGTCTTATTADVLIGSKAN